MSERMLQLENANINLTTKCDQLQQQLQSVYMYNDTMAKTVDELAQDKRNSNLFITGLKQENISKEGFLKFARETLELDAREEEIRSIFKVNKTGDPIVKIMFKTLGDRMKYFNARRKLASNKDQWLREDLTKPREHLAWLSRKAVEEEATMHSWTSMGNVLLSKGPGTKIIRINNPDDLLKIGLVPGGKNHNIHQGMALHLNPMSMHQYLMHSQVSA